MSPIYVFKCDTCESFDDLVEMSVDEYVGEFACNMRLVPDCLGTMKRVFNAPSIGQVRGAGNSPFRGSL